MSTLSTPLTEPEIEPDADEIDADERRKAYQREWLRRKREAKRAEGSQHLQDASDNLFGMVGRFHENCDPEFKPHTGAASVKELYFDKLDSDYLVGTAGSKAAGRSDTLQLFHGSEVAYWPNAGHHVEGIGQAIAGMPDTESILESTANGIGNPVHSLWTAAQAGESEYEAIFLPWHLHEEYRAEPEDWLEPAGRVQGLRISLQARQRAALFGLGQEPRLGDHHLRDPNRICWKFRQEYPATESEAFQMSDEDPFIPVERVTRARGAEVTGYGPLILGVDPARGGGDRTGLMDRQGRRLGGHVHELINSDDLMHIAGIVVRKITELRPKGLKKVCLDITGLGAGIYDGWRAGPRRNGGRGELRCQGARA